jgi:hypothetical protein
MGKRERDKDIFPDGFIVLSPNEGGTRGLESMKLRSFFDTFEILQKF